MPMTSRCWPLLPASWRPGQTIYASLCLGGQLASNRPFLPRNPAWPSSLPTPISPNSTLKCELVTQWLRWRGPLKSWVLRWTTNSPPALTPATVLSGLREVFTIMKALAGSNWGFKTETLVATYKAIVRPILYYAAPIWFTQVHMQINDQDRVFWTGSKKSSTRFHDQCEEYLLTILK